MDSYPYIRDMGRYAFFSTDIEYKFSFAVQSSEDMLEFGGKHDFSKYNEIGYAYHSWTANDDAPGILKRLKQIQQVKGYPELDWAQFSYDPAGTQRLREVLGEYLSREDASHCFYELGCIIYHQLLYEPLLTVVYEP
jgi:hypothetical protein